MNIQQALNQSLLAIAIGADRTGQVLDKGKQSAIDKYQTASKALNESKKQQVVVPAVQRDEYTEQLKNDSKGLPKSQEAIQTAVEELIKDDAKVAEVNEKATAAEQEFKRAEHNLKKWDLNHNEVNNYQKLHDKNRQNMQDNLFEDIRNAKAEARALRSQQYKQSTATNQAQAIEERIKLVKSKSPLFVLGQDAPQGNESAIVNEILGKRKMEE